MSDGTARPGPTYVIIDELHFRGADELLERVGDFEIRGEVWIRFDLDQDAYDRALAGSGKLSNPSLEDAGRPCEAAVPIALVAGVAAPSAFAGTPIDRRPVERWPPIRGPPRPSLER